MRVACVEGNDGLWVGRAWVGGSVAFLVLACVKFPMVVGWVEGGGVHSMELKPSSVFLRHNADVNWRPRMMVEIHYDSVVRRMCDREYERLAYG